MLQPFSHFYNSFNVVRPVRAFENTRPVLHPDYLRNRIAEMQLPAGKQTDNIRPVLFLGAKGAYYVDTVPNNEALGLKTVVAQRLQVMQPLV